jgi:MoaA/NifB/PqqE/SkfB family radical SAM enzyme
MNIPSLIDWSLTSKCNLDCDFCFRFLETDVTFKEQNSILSKIIDSGVKRVTLTGGEPTLSKNILYIAAELKKHNTFISLHTNGIDFENNKKIFEYFDRVSLSLDGPDIETNAIMRKNINYFSNINRFIAFLKSEQKNIVIKTVVSKANISTIPKMVNVIDDIQPNFWSLFEFLPTRIGFANKDKFLLDSGDFNNSFSKIHCKTKLNPLSRNEAIKYPKFLISSSGNVYTNGENENDILVGSLLKNTVNECWEEILKIRPINEKYLVKSEIIKNVN